MKTSSGSLAVLRLNKPCTTPSRNTFKCFIASVTGYAWSATE
jgi:hypothetical protein